MNQTSHIARPSDSELDSDRGTDALARAFVATREASARAVLDRAHGAAARALAVLDSEASRSDATGLASVVARELGEHDRIVREAFSAAIAAPKAATAASFTKAHKGNEASPALVAVSPEHTGALPRSLMRVRGPGKRTGTGANHLRNSVNGPASYPADTCAAAMSAARGKACADLSRAFQVRASSTGAARKAATSQISSIVDLFGSDAAIREICHANEWTIKIGK